MNDKQQMSCGDYAGEPIADVVKKCQTWGQVTDNGVTFDYWLVNADGAGFALFREQHMSDEQIERAQRFLRRERDVVGRIRVVNVPNN